MWAWLCFWGRVGWAGAGAGAGSGGRDEETILRASGPGQ